MMVYWYGVLLLSFAILPGSICIAVLAISTSEYNVENISSLHTNSKRILHENDDGYSEKIKIMTDPGIISGIVGGVQANIGEFPYFVEYGLGSSTNCGATLIHEDIALGAAHCRTPRFVYIKGNTLDRRAGDEVKSVIHSVIHPKYKINNHFGGNTLEYDYLILKLNSTLVDSNVRPTKLRLTEPNSTETFVAVGYGRNCSDCESSHDLLKVELSYVDHEDCNANGMYNDSLIESIHLCASSFRNDTCLGDSGGPLLDKQGNIVGITSFGSGDCANGQYPGVYSRINNPAIHKWIQHQICELSDSPPSEGCGLIQSLLERGKEIITMLLSSFESIQDLIVCTFFHNGLCRVNSLWPLNIDVLFKRSGL